MPSSRLTFLWIRLTSTLDRAPKHVVLLNGRDAVDPVVVGVAFVVGGDQTRCVDVAELLQRQQAHVPVEQDVRLSPKNGHSNIENSYIEFLIAGLPQCVLAVMNERHPTAHRR